MADEKKQELAAQDLENVDGGVILHRTKIADAIAEAEGKSEAELEGIRIAEGGYIAEGIRIAEGNRIAEM